MSVDLSLVPRRWRPSPRTVERLRELARRLDLRLPVTYARLYPGRHQRSAGAWAWCAKNENGIDVFASCEPLMKILASRKVSVLSHLGDVELFSEDRSIDRTIR